MGAKTKIKLIKADYCELDGTSYAIIATPKGLFHGFSQLKEEDKSDASRFIGCHCAEKKATIKYLKICVNEYSAQIKIMEDFYKNLSCSYRFKENSYFAKRLRKEIESLKNKKKEMLYQIESLHFSVQHIIEIRNAAMVNRSNKKN